ncbi:MAG: DUF4012 domain-containing protein [bacterium]
MPLISETIDSNQKILIVSDKNSNFVKYLKQILENYSINTYYSAQLPKNHSNFDFIFVINSKRRIDSFYDKKTAYTYFFINRKNRVQSFVRTIIDKKIKNIKVISLDYEVFSGKDLEKILWFIFSNSVEVLLKMKIKQEHNIVENSKIITKYIQKKFSIKFIFITALIFFLSIIPFLTSSTYYLYKSSRAIKTNESKKAEIYLSYGRLSLNSASSIYKITRPIYLMFSIALFPDNIFEINKRLETIVQKSVEMSINGNRFVSSLFEKDISNSHQNSQSIRIEKISSDIDILINELGLLNQKVPDNNKFFQKNKQEITNLTDSLTKAKLIIANVKDILAYNTEKKYLLLFANNMELRPGGGFIGSFGILTVKNLTIKDIKIYDVYDADGQLKKHINPPAPIRKYLSQPNWFLRDSAFSPDFFENYNQAKQFLDIELELNDFSGGILITTTAIQNILGAMDEISLPDFNEKINKDNFYIKTQLYSEKDFFPGSTQKKSFLASLTGQIFANLENASFPKLFDMLNKSLDEKQITLIFDDDKIQSTFDSQYWSGKRILPVCFSKVEKCCVDYIFPYDSNFGVNKANFFITRTLNLDVKINKEGDINNKLSTLINNESQSDMFPGGTYKNYMQISIPRRAIIKNLTRNGVLIENYDETTTDLKTIGFLTEIPPQKSIEIELNYTLQKAINEGDSIYQLIFQKQIGSNNSDFTINLQVAKNIIIQDQNFNPVVKKDGILYNTTLTGDKIFILKLRKN